MPTELEVRLYVRPDGVAPYSWWFLGLRDWTIRKRVQERIARLRIGNFGDFRSVGGGVHELRIPVGPGIRVYFGRRDASVVILLCGGDKQSQPRDIRRAQLDWREYRSRSDG